MMQRISQFHKQLKKIYLILPGECAAPAKRGGALVTPLTDIELSNLPQSASIRAEKALGYVPDREKHVNSA
jgi:hypothetical protein